LIENRQLNFVTKSIDGFSTTVVGTSQANLANDKGKALSFDRRLHGRPANEGYKKL